MKKLVLLAVSTCLGVSLLAGCGSPADGYYDHNGNWIATDTPHNQTNIYHSPLPGGRDDDYYADDNNYVYHAHYKHRGYYDYNGVYVADYSGTAVPDDMFPPRGMCRVWFDDRDPEDQPAIESCKNIRSRVPQGAYVIYGG